MNRIVPNTLALVAAGSLAVSIAAGAANAQGDPMPTAQSLPRPLTTGPRAEFPSWIKESAKDPRLYDVDFPGGSLAEYYRGVSSAPDAKTLLPLVVSELAEAVRLQPINLRNASVGALYQLPARLNPWVTIQEAGFSSLIGGDGKELLVGAYVVGVDPQAAAGGKASRPATFNLDFPGGTVDAYVAAIRSACPAANIVILADAGSLPVPALSFRDVTVAAAMATLDTNMWRPDGSATSIVTTSIGIANSPEAIFKIESREHGPDVAPTEVRVFSLGRFLEAGGKTPDLLSAVEAALSIVDGEAKLKYHEATHLLIARGNKSHLYTVEKVMSEVLNSQVSQNQQAGEQAR